MYYRDYNASTTDYSAFGVELTGRNFNSKASRFGFNGKEKDDEVFSSAGTSYDYGARMYDPRLGRFLSVDPITKQYPGLTPYQFASNRPIDGVDKDGLEWATTKTYDVATGVFTITNTLTLKVINSSNVITNNEAMALATLIAKNTAAIGSSFDTKTKTQYNTVVNTEFVKKEDIGTKDLYLNFEDAQGKLQPNGMVDYDAGEATGGLPSPGESFVPGSSQTNQIDLAVSVTYGSNTINLLDAHKRDIVRSGSHEILHTAGIRHPYDPSVQGTINEAGNSDNIMMQSKFGKGMQVEGQQEQQMHDNIVKDEGTCSDDCKQ